MGIVIHKATIVTSWNGAKIGDAVAEAEKLFPGLVTPVITSPVNVYYSFLITTCGSKEGWADKEADDAAREAFAAWIAEQAYEDGSNALEFVMVEYGNDLAARDWHGEAKTVGVGE